MKDFSLKAILERGAKIQEAIGVSPLQKVMGEMLMNIDSFKLLEFQKNRIPEYIPKR